MAPTLTLAHVSDPHLAPVPLPTAAEWSLKRGLGLLNWYRLRMRQHRASTLARLMGDLNAQRADHIAVTGDLVNIGLAAEHAAASHWLASLGSSDRVSAIPGNHDIYAETDGICGTASWQAYMASTDGAGAATTADNAGAVAGGFPFVRRIGPAVLIGLNSGVPTPPFRATGRLGPDQLAALARLLERFGAERRPRVVLIHHPPLPGQAGARCALLDAVELAAVLARHGAELVLHGHNHRAMLAFAQGPRGRVPVVGAASASMAEPRGSQTLARYNLFRLAPDPDVPIEWIERGLVRPDGPVVELGRHLLAPAAAVA
jgi:3',5'-cyclic AMP phosphodiesterase CpdA